MTIQKKSDEIRLFFEVALNKETTQKISEMLSDTYYSFITVDEDLSNCYHIHFAYNDSSNDYAKIHKEIESCYIDMAIMDIIRIVLDTEGEC